MINDEARTISRRDALKLVVAASAAIPALQYGAFAAEATVAAQPYGTDPLLNKMYQPGELWPLTLNDHQQATVRTLADLILPADDQSPAASSVGAVEFVDEWISAPYDAQRNDRDIILKGLEWIDREARQRFANDFSKLDSNQQSAIADDIAHADRAAAGFKEGAAFFARFRSIAAGGYYATRAGWKDIGYIGNLPLAKFELPPQEVLERLGVEG